jgi:hypothetical protein
LILRTAEGGRRKVYQPGKSMGGSSPELQLDHLYESVAVDNPHNKHGCFTVYRKGGVELSAQCRNEHELAATSDEHAFYVFAVGKSGKNWFAVLIVRRGSKYDRSGKAHLLRVPLKDIVGTSTAVLPPSDADLTGLTICCNLVAPSSPLKRKRATESEREQLNLSSSGGFLGAKGIVNGMRSRAPTQPSLTDENLPPAPKRPKVSKPRTAARRKADSAAWSSTTVEAEASKQSESASVEPPDSEQSSALVPLALSGNAPRTPLTDVTAIAQRIAADIAANLSQTLGAR